MATAHRHAARDVTGRARVDRRPTRRPIDPTIVRLVALAIYLGIVALMVLLAGPASASDASASGSGGRSALPSVLFPFLVVVGGGLVVRTIRRRGRLPDHRRGDRPPRARQAHPTR